ncbi:MAG: undecaprenyl-diphosphate phosphatase [Candidatus Aenigmarchaeota archaeon]
MVTYLEAFILAIVQGITEWLPVSSSGHLVILQQVFGMSADISFDLMLHFATLIVVLLVFWRDIVDVLKAFITVDIDSPDWRFAFFIIAGMIPTGLIGYYFEAFFTSAFSSLTLVGSALLITGLLLFLTKYPPKARKLDFKRAILIGIFQGIAITPGISRSGATISAAISTGVDRKKAVRFSFLLFIPAMVGAMLFKLSDIAAIGLSDTGPVMLGMITAIIVGFFSLKLLIRLIISKKFHWFALYCWILGIALLLLAF